MRSYFFINENQSFEDSIMKSAQLTADDTALHMDPFTNPQEEFSLKTGSSVTLEEREGTQLLIGQVPARFPRGKGSYSYGVCIYSIHGNANRSIEGLNCFGSVDPRQGYSNEYVRQYLTAIRSIRVGP